MSDRLPARHDDYLDGVRGLAALIVLFGHCSNARIDIVPGLDLSVTGKIGVWLFFVLSAYLLARKLVSELADTTGATGAARVIAAYAVKRLFRILPAYFVFLSGVAALGIFRPGEALRHALLIEGRDHLWTIPVEMTFYAFLPIAGLALARCPSRWRLRFSLALVVAAAVAYWMLAPEAIRTNSIHFPPYALFFTFGILVAQCRTGPGKPAATGIVVAAAIVIPLLAPRSVAFFLGSPVMDAFVWSWAIGLAWCGLLYALMTADVLRRLFASPILRYYGRISFSLYLTHFYLIGVVAGYAGSPNIVRGFVLLVLATIVASGLHLAVEVPGLRLGAALARKITRGIRADRTVLA
jgi:peptidoglycan/LPS O-acetylase OafA/YrhL